MSKIKCKECDVKHKMGHVVCDRQNCRMKYPSISEVLNFDEFPKKDPIVITSFQDKTPDPTPPTNDIWEGGMYGDYTQYASGYWGPEHVEKEPIRDADGDIVS